MGLDMYLVEKKSKYVGSANKAEHTRLSKALGDLVDCDSDSGYEVTVTQERIYWRKANAIHNWFVNNVQDGNDDCGEYPVTCQQLSTLRDICNKILIKEPWDTVKPYVPKKEQVEVAKNLLPSTAGFFFGSTEYDEHYIEDLRYTVDSIDNILKDVTWDTLKNEHVEYPNFYYQSSW